MPSRVTASANSRLLSSILHPPSFSPYMHLQSTFQFLFLSVLVSWSSLINAAPLPQSDLIATTELEADKAAPDISNLAFRLPRAKIIVTPILTRDRPERRRRAPLDASSKDAAKMDERDPGRGVGSRGTGKRDDLRGAYLL